MKASRETFANLDKDAMIDIAFALDGAIRAMINNNARLAECFSDVKDVPGAIDLVGMWAASNALAVQTAQDVLTDAFAKAASKLN